MRRMKTGLIFAGILLFISCQKDLSPISGGTLNLTLESVECTEAWLTLSVDKPDKQIIYVVKRDTHIVFNGAMLKSDALLHDAGLEPASNYLYKAYRQSHEETACETSLTITTMDTTSHNFTWQVYEFGGYSSSAFFDVAIIDENDIWAVGDICTPDGDFNAAHWDGEKWELRKFEFLTFCNQTHTGIYPANSIIAFSKDDIWISSGSKITRIVNNKQVLLDCIPVSVNKFWGTGSDNIYAVGVLGKIANYDGQEWSKIESGTELEIQDIWGALNDKTGEYEILCVASDKYYNRGNKLLSIKDNKVVPLPATGLPWSLSSIWFVPSHTYYICGDGIYTSRDLNNVWQEEKTFPLFYKERIRGTNFNNIATAGSYGLLSHYNGATWRHYKDTELPVIIGIYYGLDINEQVVTVVGQNGSKAIIVTGIGN